MSENFFKRTNWKYVALALLITIILLVVARSNSRGRSEHITKTIGRVTFDLNTLPKIEEMKHDTVRIGVTGLTKTDHVLLRFVVQTPDGLDTVFSSQVLEDWGSGIYRGELIGGTKGGRRQYYVDVVDSTKQTIARLKDENGHPLATRFIGAVPPVVLGAHLLFIFATVFFVSMGALYGWRLIKGEDTVKYVAIHFFWAAVTCFLGGYPFGFAMNYYAFGGLWEAVPFGTDATDNKTQLIFIYVLFAAVVGAGHYGKGLLGRPVFTNKSLGYISVTAVVVMALIYLIPHSIQFSAGLTYFCCYAFIGTIILWYLVGFFGTRLVVAEADQKRLSAHPDVTSDGMNPRIEHLPKLIAEKAKILEAAGIQSAGAEVEWMLCHILDVDRLNLYLHGAQLLNDDRLSRLDEVVTERATRRPLQFILNESWFYGRRFFVTEDVMAPTPETELLCETALRFIHQRKLERPSVVDVGVGSGVIALTVAMEMPIARIVGLDISAAALEVAKRNMTDLGAGERVELRQSDLFSGLCADERFDLILSNPPYIAEADYAGLEPEVKADPKIAMTAGVEGLDIIKRLVHGAPKFLAPGGRIMFEIGYGQSAKIATLTSSDSRYTGLEILQDLNGIDRIIVLSCAE